MKIYRTLLMACPLVLLLSGCGAREESRAWRKEFKEFKAGIVGAVDTLAVSIPGERERRLIEAAHSDKTEVRAKARKMIISLYGIFPSQA